MNKLNFNSAVCTSVEQSHRLLDLGLSPYTSDMCWLNISDLPACAGYTVFKKAEDEYKLNITPAWSLHRLKCLLPTKIPYASGYLTIEIINNVNLMFMTDTSEQRVISFIHEDLYESMIKCIKWLINENYFNKEYLKQ